MKPRFYPVLMPFRIDKGKFKVIETGEGFLKARISIARPGVFTYTKSDGSIVHEAKLPEDLFSQSTIDSVIGAPIVDTHPNTPEKMVTSENYKKYAKGNVSNPHVENNEIVAIATYYDPVLIKKIKNREQNEVSIGYTYQPSLQSGFYNNEEYQSADKNIIINHIAMEQHGRAGERIKVHLDRGALMPKKWNVEGDNTSNSLTYRKFDGSTDIQVAPEIHKELMAIKNDSKENSQKIEQLKSENEKLMKENEKIKMDKKDEDGNKELEAKLEIANDKAKEWEKKFDALNASVPEMIEKGSIEKFELVEFAKSVDTKMKIDGLSNKDIKLQIIAKGLPFKEGVKTDSLTNEIIEARYDAACDLLRTKAADKKNNNYAGGEVKIDRNEIEKKRADLQTVYQRAREAK